MKKQRGQAYPGVVITVTILAIAVIFAIIFAHKPCSKHGKHAVVKGEFLKPTDDGQGRYAYKDDDGDWFIYYWMLTSDNSYYAARDEGGYTYRSIDLPKNGTWEALDREPPEDEVVADNVEEQIAETEQGLPETESQFEEPSESAPSESAPDASSDSGGDGGGGD